MENNEFLDRLKKRIIEDRTKQSTADWVSKNTTLSQGVPFSFKNHKFQEDIINDPHPTIYVKKLSQVGLTEVAIRRAIAFMANYNGVKTLYAFPDLTMKKKQTQTRILPIFNRDFPVNRGEICVRNNDVIQLRDSYMFICGNSEGDSTSLSVDSLYLDEYDLSDTQFLALVNSRIQHSQYKYRFGLSTPTWEQYGIDKDFKTSDQREYFVRCPHCNCWQIPMYSRENVFIPNLPDSVESLAYDITPDIAACLDLDNAYVKCSKCGKPLELGDDADREWVATYPDRINIRGYQVRPFSSNILSIKYLVNTMSDYIRRGEIRRGINTVLGESYSDTSTRLEVKDIEMCMIDERPLDVDKSKPCFFGCDVGINSTISIITGDADLVRFEVIPFDRLLDRFKELETMYNIVGGCIDRHPQIILSNSLRDISNGRIMPAVYHDGRTVEPHTELDGNIDYYKVNRTNALDYVRDLIVTHKLRMFGYVGYKNTIITHLRNMWRDDGLEKDAIPRWVKLDTEDHAFHSISYAFVSRKIFDYENSLGEVENRQCFDIIGANRDNKTLYNDNLLTYDSSRVKHTSKRLRW